MSKPIVTTCSMALLRLEPEAYAAGGGRAVHRIEWRQHMAGLMVGGVSVQPSPVRIHQSEHIAENDSHRQRKPDHVGGDRRRQALDAYAAHQPPDKIGTYRQR